MRICQIAPHFSEEPILSGEKGSGAVFFSGCVMDCEFCQNYEISKAAVGKIYSPRELADALKTLEKTGVHNINFVTPTQYSHKIRETLNIYRPNIPIVYNTSGYERTEILREMHPYVDVYLPDFKYAENSLGEKYSGRKNYADVCVAAIDEMVSAKPPIVENGIMKRGVAVRHLMLPGETENTLRVIKIFAERWKGKAYFSLMSQFFPTYKSTVKRTLKPLEYKIALRKIINLGIEDCFVQDLSSATDAYVPKFDLGEQGNGD